MISESEYHKLYDRIPAVLLESVGMPTNYNLLNTAQLNFYYVIVDNTISRYKDSYVELLKSFQEDMDSLKQQTQEVINELS